ncbi:MAG: phosphoglycerate kinase [Candidatus Omnitrophota bacterium]
MSRKVFSWLIVLTMLFQQTGFAQVAAVELNLAGQLSKIAGSLTTDTFRPVHIRFFSYDAANDAFKVMLDKGDTKNLTDTQLNASNKVLMNYFLIGVTLPNDSFWVNLRPDSEDNIIDNYLAKTDVGKVMLEADLQLKKDTARFTSPQTPEGREYWTKLYKKAEELYGYENVSIPALTRPWIVPNEIIVRETAGSAYIYKATLKVMLEQDYLKDSSDYNFKDTRSRLLNEYSSQLIRELILPKLTKEVNLSKTYAPLRQAYYSLIFSRWFKTRFANQTGQYASLIDSSNLTNLTSKTSWSKDTYFQAYKNSFAKGEYNISETVHTPTGQVIRTYFSGGIKILPQNLPYSGTRVADSPITDVLLGAGLVDPNASLQPNKIEAASPIQVSSPDDLLPVITNKGIKQAIMALDWNVSVKDGKIVENERIVNSLDTIKWVFQEAGLDYAYVLTHSGRPSGKGYEEAFTLRPMANEAARLLSEAGVNNVEVIMLPINLTDAKTLIDAKKAEAAASRKKVLFVVENVRMYGGEQSKNPAVREQFERDLIALTGETTEKLIYLEEAFDKSHRAEEASMEMGALLFPRENIAAGVKVADEAEKVLDFLSKATGKLVVIAGGAKFDKLKNIADIGKRIGLTGGKLFVVGALANPLLDNAGVNVGKSLMPTKPDDVKGFKDGQKKLIENTRDNKLQSSLPVDFVVREGKVVKDTLEPTDEQIDIGPKTIKMIVDYINSLKAGDGILMNGGAGVFDKEWGSKAGTIAIVTAANEAAARGVAVLFGGGDMFNAVKIVQRETGLRLDPSIKISTAGGALFVAISKGVGGGLVPVRATMKFPGEAEKKLLGIYSAVTEAIPGAIVLPVARTPYKDTSVAGDDSTREPALDLSRGPDGHRLLIPDGRRADLIKNFYETTFLPVIVTAEDVMNLWTSEQVAAFQAAKKEKDVTAFAQQLIRPVLASKGIPAQESQERSHALDPGLLGEAAVDVSSIIAIRTLAGDFLGWIPVVIKRGEDKAHEALGQKIAVSAAQGLEKTEKQPFALPPSIDISNHNNAFNALKTYNPLLFEKLQNNDLPAIRLLTGMINNLDPKAMVDPGAAGIKFDKQLGVFISEMDMDAKATAPGFGKNLERFRGSLYAVGQTSARLYHLLTPNYDTQRQVGIAIKNKDLQDAVIKFYALMQRHLLEVAINYFKDARVFESLRVEIGDYARRLNEAVREADALELSQASGEDILIHLSAKGVVLSANEKFHILEFIHGSGGLFDVLQLAALMRADNFVQSFRHIKLDNPLKVLPSDKPFEAYDGSGRIGRTQLAQRLAADINGQEEGYIGRYMVASQELKGESLQEKFFTAVQKASEMLSDRQIEDAKLNIQLGTESAVLTDLIKNGLMSFRLGANVLAAQLDFQDTYKVSSVYPVQVNLDGRMVGVIYFVDMAQFKAGMEVALKASGRQLDNIPRPFIVRGENDEEIFFGLRVDATPGGVEIGDQALEKAGAKGAVKLSGDTLWKLFAKSNLPETYGAKLGATDELSRIRQIYEHVKNTRMPKEGGKQLIYDKAQIPKSMLLPGFNFMDRHLGWVLPYVGGSDVMYMTPGSCSTNGAAHAISALTGFAGNAESIGPTFHMYTSSDKIVEKNPYGHTALKSTGAAKGVVLLLSFEEGSQTFFTAIRTPTGLVKGKADIVGGSIFDLLVRLPNNIPEKLTVRYLSRIAAEFPQDLLMFTPEDMREGSYTWQDTIAGQRTGSILYKNFIERVAPNTLRIKVGYDNEFSFATMEKTMHDAVYLDAKRNRQTAQMAEVLDAALTYSASSPATTPILEKLNLMITTVTPSQTTTLGKPALRLDMGLAGGAKGHFVVPAGTSTGEDEAKTILDRFGFGRVLKNIVKIHSAVMEEGLVADELAEIGQLMLNMSKDELGAEVTLSYQMSSAWAAASQKGLQNYEFVREMAPDLASKGVPVTKIQQNNTNGGQHAPNSLDMQEFMVVPIGKTTAESNKMGDNIDRALGFIYQQMGLKANPDDKGVGELRGKEGGYKIGDLTNDKLKEIYQKAGSYNIKNLDIVALRDQGVGVHEFVLNCQMAAIRNAGYVPSTSGEVRTVALALDPAATSMLVEGHDNLYNFEGRQITSKELVAIYKKWAEKYPIDSLEDGLGENDWEGWLDLVEAVGDKVMVITDDLTVSQAGRFLRFIDMLKQRGFIGPDGKVTKRIGILIKLNQNGFLTTGINDPAKGWLGTIEVIRIAKKYGIKWIVSHRSNEAGPEENEVSIAELAAGTDAYALKSGDHVQAVRAVKEDRLAEIDARERNKAAASPMTPGGIDFRGKPMNITYEPLGNFSELNLKLPTLSKKELASFDVESELRQIENMVNRKLLPSGARVKELLAACSQKGELNRMQERVMVLLIKMGILEESACCTQEASREYKEALILVDSLVS